MSLLLASSMGNCIASSAQHLKGSAGICVYVCPVQTACNQDWAGHDVNASTVTSLQAWYRVYKAVTADYTCEQLAMQCLSMTLLSHVC